MRERDFEEYLLSDESIKSKMKAVNSRLSKARLIERELGVDLLFPMTKKCFILL